MGRDLGPKCKLCRREGEKLFLKGARCQSAKCAIVKRNYPPGFHGVKGLKRLSDFGQQLRAKQKAKRIYNISESVLSRYFKIASGSKEDTGRKLLRLLESRLDNVVFRIGLAESRIQARQRVSHGYILVNGRKVNIASFRVNSGDVIGLNSNKKKSKIYAQMEEKMQKGAKHLPSWLVYDEEKKGIRVLNLPEKDDFEAAVNDKLIVEFYSK